MLFDLTGLMIIHRGGGGALSSRRRPGNDSQSAEARPYHDDAAWLIVLLGFILEGLRIAMTGWPSGAQYAFIGYGLSLLLKVCEK